MQRCKVLNLSANLIQPLGDWGTNITWTTCFLPWYKLLRWLNKCLQTDKLTIWDIGGISYSKYREVLNKGILKVLRKPYLFILGSNARMTPLSSSHFCSTLPSKDRAQLLLQQNCFTLTSLLRSVFPALTDVLIPLSPKSAYPFPYCSQPGRRVVPYRCGEGWVRLSVSTRDPSPGSGCCPVPPPTSPATQQQGISLPSWSSLALCLPSVLRWVEVCCSAPLFQALSVKTVTNLNKLPPRRQQLARTQTQCVTCLPMSPGASRFIALNSDPWRCRLCPRDSPQPVLFWQTPSDPLSWRRPPSLAAAKGTWGCSSCLPFHSPDSEVRVLIAD